jgi:hypothetical protein
MCRCTRKFSPVGTADGCPGLRRGRFSAVPTGLGRASDPTQDYRPGLSSARAVQTSESPCFLTMQLVDCFEESLAEQNQVGSVDRLLSKWQQVFEVG